LTKPEETFARQTAFCRYPLQVENDNWLCRPISESLERSIDARTPSPSRETLEDCVRTVTHGYVILREPTERASHQQNVGALASIATNGLAWVTMFAVTPEQERWAALAKFTVRASWRHMALSVLINGLILSFLVAHGAGLVPQLFIVGCGVTLVTYNFFRIRGARAALASPSRLERFVDGQRRSQQVRGRVFLVIGPVLVVGAWMGVLLHRDQMRSDTWFMMAVITLFLGWGWRLWWRTLKRNP
jgi:hypothetical protein